MLKNTLYLLIACCLLTGCVDDYEWDTKMIVEGRVVDQNGNPQKDVDITTKIYYHSEGIALFGDWGPDSKIISFTKTDADGVFRMMFPRPKNEDDIVVLINTNDDRDPINSQLSSTIIYNIDQVNFNDHLVNLGEHTVFSVGALTTLNIETNDDPSLDGYITAIEVNGLLKQSVINYNFDAETQESQYYTFETFNVAANQTVTVKYQIRTIENNGPVFTTNEVPVQIGTEPVIHTINY